MKFTESVDGVLINPQNTVGIYDKVELLSDKLQAAYKYKSPIKSKKLCFVSTNSNEYNGEKYKLFWEFKSETEKTSYFDPKLIKTIDYLPGCILYLISSEYHEITTGDGGVLLAEFGSKIILVAPIHRDCIKFLSDLSIHETLPSKRNIKAFLKILDSITEYKDRFGVSNEEFLEHLEAIFK